MSTREQVEALRAQADALDAIAKLEDKALAAKEAYRADKSDKLRDKHRAASTALAEARSEVRQEFGGLTIGGDAASDAIAQPETVKGKVN